MGHLFGQIGLWIEKIGLWISPQFPMWTVWIEIFHPAISILLYRSSVTQY
jgi:hypothetical protein